MRVLCVGSSLYFATNICEASGNQSLDILLPQSADRQQTEVVQEHMTIMPP